MIDYTFSLKELEYFLLIFVRVSMFIYIAPFYSMKGVPRQVKIGLSFFVALLLFQVIGTHEYPVYNSVWGYAVIVMKEALTGLLIGMGANICTTILAFAGRIIDMETGMAMSNLMDPTTKEMSSVSGVLYQYMVTLILIISGMYQYLLKALAETYQLIPVNGAIVRSEAIVNSLIGFLGNYISIGFRICLPVFAVMLLLNAVLGIMARVAPQMNMFSVGMQLKVLVGLCVLFITTGLIPGMADFIYTEMKIMVVDMVEALM